MGAIHGASDGDLAQTALCLVQKALGETLKPALKIMQFPQRKNNLAAYSLWKLESLIAFGASMNWSPLGLKRRLHSGQEIQPYIAVRTLKRSGRTKRGKIFTSNSHADQR